MSLSLNYPFLSVKPFYALYLLGLLASIFVVFLPAVNVLVDPTLVWTTFMSLSPLSLTRVLSGYFLVAVFPGTIIYLCLIKKNAFNFFEKIGLVLALSYCYSVISGLFLLYFEVFSSLSFVLSLWIFTFSVNALRRLIGKADTETLGHSVLSFDLNSLMLFSMSFIMIFFSYLLVLFIGPLAGITSGDVINYMNMANSAVNFGPFVRAPYIWSNVFFWITGSITGLPMFYAYAGLQFYQLLLLTSFYMFVRTLFPMQRKIAYIASLLLFFISGLTSLVMLSLFMVSPNMFEMYMGKDTLSVLSFTFSKTGAPGISPLSVGVGTFDISLVFLALAFAYRYLSEEACLSSLFLSGLFASAAFFTHSVNSVPIFFGAVFVFSLLQDVSKRALGKLVLLTITLTILLDPLSKLFLSSIWFPWTFLPLSETINYIIGVSLLLVGVITYTFLLIFRERLGRKLKLFSPQHLSSLFERNSVALIFWSIGILVFLASVFIYLLNYESIEYTRIWYQPDYIFPWYYIIFRTYGVTFPLAIGSIAYLMIKYEKRTSIFIISWLLSILIYTIGSFSLPGILPPSLIYNRNSEFLSYPFSILAALGLINTRVFSTISGASAHIKRAAFKKVISISVVIIMSLSFLSNAYSRELFFHYGQNQAISCKIAEAITWINSNLPSGAKILPLSESTGSEINCLASNIHVFPIMNQYSESWLPYSWLHDILLRSSSPEISLYALTTLGVSYIVGKDSDISDLRTKSKGDCFLSVLNSFPIVFENDEVKIYAVPNYPIYADSNFVLVYPTLNIQLSSLEVMFNLLVSSGTNFSILNNIDLRELKPNYVYFFPHDGQLPPYISGKISQSTEWANTSAIEFADGHIYNFETLTVKRYNGSASQQVLASFLFTDGSRAPYILYQQIDNATLIFIYTSPLSNFMYSKNYRELLQYTIRIMKNVLPNPNSPKELHTLPYHPDVFKYIVPSLLGLWQLKGLHDTLLYYNDIKILGNTIIESDHFFLSNDSLPVERIVIRNITGEFMIENSTMRNFILKGSSILYSNLVKMTIVNNTTGSYTIIKIYDFESCDLELSSTEIMFETEINGTSQQICLSNANVNILFKDGFIALVKQPRIIVDGVVEGILQGVVTYEGNFFFIPQEYAKTTLTGRFSLEILDSSGLIYSKVTNIQGIAIVKEGSYN